MTLDKFITKWKGNKADFDGRYGGECVDLYNYYMRDVFGLNPYQYGAVEGAKDLARQLPKYKSLKWVKNNPDDPNQLPPRGAIIVFNGPIGGGYGHVGIVLKASANRLIIFDQIGAINPNNEQPANTRNQTNLWSYVLGWAYEKESKMLFKDAGHTRRVLISEVLGRNRTQAHKDKWTEAFTKQYGHKTFREVTQIFWSSKEAQNYRAKKDRAFRALKNLPELKQKLTAATEQRDNLVKDLKKITRKLKEAENDLTARPTIAELEAYRAKVAKLQKQLVQAEQDAKTDVESAYRIVINHIKYLIMKLMKLIGASDERQNK